MLELWDSRELEASADAIVGALEECKADEDWTKDKGKWIPGALKWIGAEPWKVETPAANRPADDLFSKPPGLTKQQIADILPTQEELDRLHDDFVYVPPEGDEPRRQNPPAVVLSVTGGSDDMFDIPFGEAA